MKRAIHGALFATLAGALTFGAAASLDVRAENLGSGAAAVVACDSDGVDVAYEFLANEPTLVDALIVRDVDAACLSQTMTVSVSDSTSLVIATGVAVVDGETVTVDITPTPAYTLLSDSVASDSVAEVSVTITGAPVS